MASTFMSEILTAGFAKDYSIFAKIVRLLVFRFV